MSDIYLQAKGISMEREMQLSLDFQSLRDSSDCSVGIGLSPTACDRKLPRASIPVSNVVLFGHSRLPSHDLRPAVTGDAQVALITKILNSVRFYG